MTDNAPDPSPLDEPPDAPLEEMRRREHAWQRSHRVEALWPGLDAVLLQTAADAIGEAVAGVLRGERPTLRLAGATADASARATGVAALLTGVGPLLGAWIERERLGADPVLARVLARHLAHGRARHARIRRAVVPVLARMARAGLEPGVIKGFHTALVYFPDAGARPMADVDVVVAPEHWEHAESLLREAGFTTAGATHARKREWTPPGADDGVFSHELWHARSRWRLELHRGLDFDAVTSTIDTPQPARLDERLMVDGTTLRVADPNELIAILATHGSTELYSHRLLRLVELVLVVRRARELGGLRWPTVADRPAARGTSRFAYPSLTLVEQLAPGTIDPALLAGVHDATTPRIRAVTARLTPTAPLVDAPFSLAERLLWVTGARATARRFWRMVAPLEGASATERLRRYQERAARLLLALASVARRSRSRS